MGDSADNTSNLRRCGQIGEGEEDTITMEEALKEEDRLKEEASAVLGASDPVNCSYSKGYIDRQAVYACATCTPNGNAGVCLACSNVCHEGHDLHELYTKRYFCCDCGNDKFPGKECKLEKNKVGMNSRNRYNHNFSGVYCTCRRPYPDHDDDLEDEMIQCILCEDWLHGRHLHTSAPDEFVEMICHECMSKYPFLWTYNLKFSYEATKKDVKSDSNEMIDVVSSDQRIQDQGSENCTSDNNRYCTTEQRQESVLEDSKIVKIQGLDLSPRTTESGPVDPTTANSLTQHGNAQTESSAVKRSSSPQSEESESSSKKIKLEPACRNNEEEVCLLKSLEQPTSEFREHATFWPMGWRSKLCKCDECMNMYRDREIEFLLDESDTVQAYEERGNSVQHANVEEENEADMFAGLDRVAQIEVARALSKDQLTTHADTSQKMKVKRPKSHGGLDNSLAEHGKRRRRRCWVSDWLLKRNCVPFDEDILQQLKAYPDDFKNILRMDETVYVKLLRIVTPLIEKKFTIMRVPISPHERLTATLRFLATGIRYQDLQFVCCISAQALSHIVPETCNAIYKALVRDYMKFPTSAEEWLEVAQVFEERFQFPNCLGAVGGKHVAIVPPPGSGSYFLNHKDFHSMVLIAIANADKEFIYINFGTNGHISDGSVIENTDFYEKLSEGSLKLPDPNPRNDLPYVFISDESFTLRKDFLKPYNVKKIDDEKKVFNNRISRARSVVENVFNILISRFGVLTAKMKIKPENIDSVVLACCVLHNFLKRNAGENYISVDSADSEVASTDERQEALRTGDNNIAALMKGQNRNPSTEAKQIRDMFKMYFINGERLSSQDTT